MKNFDVGNFGALLKFARRPFYVGSNGKIFFHERFHLLHRIDDRAVIFSRERFSNFRQGMRGKFAAQVDADLTGQGG